MMTDATPEAQALLAKASEIIKAQGTPLAPVNSLAVEIDEAGNDFVRFVTPVFAGWFITAFAKRGIHMSQAQAYSQIFPFVSSVYFVGVRYLESKVPAFGRLLGIKKPVKK